MSLAVRGSGFLNMRRSDWVFKSKYSVCFMLMRVLPRSLRSLTQSSKSLAENFYESLAFTADVGWGRGKGCLLAETLLKWVLPRSFEEFGRGVQGVWQKTF